MNKVKVKTYDPRKVIITFGPHTVTGYAEDSFVTVEPAGEGITTVVGCDGEVARALDPNKTALVKISLLQTSVSSKYFNKLMKLDDATGNGILPLMITDLRGGELFHADEAWVTKQSPFVRGKATNAREWEIQTGYSEFIEN